MKTLFSLLTLSSLCLFGLGCASEEAPPTVPETELGTPAAPEGETPATGEPAATPEEGSSGPALE